MFSPPQTRQTLARWAYLISSSHISLAKNLDSSRLTSLIGNDPALMSKASSESKQLILFFLINTTQILSLAPKEFSEMADLKLPPQPWCPSRSDHDNSNDEAVLFPTRVASSKSKGGGGGGEVSGQNTPLKCPHGYQRELQFPLKACQDMIQLLTHWCLQTVSPIIPSTRKSYLSQI